MKSYITIDEILKRKHFDKTEVVAGTAGINRQVKWIHVLEVTQVSHLLNGQELILTTGIGWRNDPLLFLSFVKQLVECNVSGICIELGTHTTVIPPEVIEFANLHQFPIILFHHEVPFVEITQDIHSIIINKQYQLISDLESYSQQLNRKMLDMNNYEQILEFMQNYLDVQVISMIYDNEVKFVPDLREKMKANLLTKLESKEEWADTSIARQPIQILGGKYAELIIVSNDKKLTEFDLLILDRTATALAQHLLRNLYVEEKRMADESEWLTNWLEGEYTEEIIREQLSFMDPKVSFKGGVVCVFNLKIQQKMNSTKLDETYYKLLFRNVFEQLGFRMFSIEVNHHLIIILGNNRSLDDWKDRVSEAFGRINKADSTGKISLSLMKVAVGKFVHKLSEIHLSYQTAKETLQLQDTLLNENKSYFYQDLHIYRMMQLLKRYGNLEETINEYLGAVIEYDHNNNGELMSTLRTYLACHGSKQETSNKLFIVRQTLYHRIEKLEKLLGKDFMNSERRFAIEFMLLAYDYLTTSETAVQLQYKV
ncbi:PucR family transcriptional regulator [Bacillus sp. 03113]|uniref:PucR family transcriptional regulator n=1 Tax=Bacillus sp. 03113 TaxID=2578211 RepID=UPI001143E925|nr:PucR family transcriptional regulator [Bacillus sp. 03113]